MKKLHDLTYEDMGTPRYRRARDFANTIMSLMRDFIPRDRDCLRKIERHLMEIGWEGNVEVINVPPAWDALTKTQIEMAKLESHPAFVKRPLGESS